MNAATNDALSDLFLSIPEPAGYVAIRRRGLELLDVNAWLGNTSDEHELLSDKPCLYEAMVFKSFEGICACLSRFDVHESGTDYRVYPVYATRGSTGDTRPRWSSVGYGTEFFPPELMARYTYEENVLAKMPAKPKPKGTSYGMSRELKVYTGDYIEACVEGGTRRRFICVDSTRNIFYWPFGALYGTLYGRFSTGYFKVRLGAVASCCVQGHVRSMAAANIVNFSALEPRSIEDNDAPLYDLV